MYNGLRVQFQWIISVLLLCYSVEPEDRVYRTVEKGHHGLFQQVAKIVGTIAGFLLAAACGSTIPRTMHPAKLLILWQCSLFLDAPVPLLVESLLCVAEVRKYYQGNLSGTKKPR